MSFGYKNYREKLTKEVGGLKARLKKDRMFDNAKYIKRNFEIKEIKQLNKVIKEAEEQGNNREADFWRQRLKEVEKLSTKYVDEDRDLDVTSIGNFFKKIDEKLVGDDSLEELEEVEREIEKFMKSFSTADKIARMAAMSFPMETVDENQRSGWLKKVRAFENEALGIRSIKDKEAWQKQKNKARKSAKMVYQVCQQYLDCINRLQMSKKFKKKAMRGGDGYIYDITNPLEALRTGKFEFLLPFMGGKEPLTVRTKVNPTTREKIFEFDRNFATRIEGVHLDVVVNQFCDFFKKEIDERCYMEFDFRDKKDLFRICEELAKREVKLDLEKMDLPRADQHKLVGIYIENLRKDEDYAFSTYFNSETKKQEDFISKSKLRELCTRVKITPALQKDIWDRHQVRILGGTEATLDQKNSDTAEITMSDFGNNGNSQVVNNSM